MNKIKFLKNNKIVDIIPDEIDFESEFLILKKETKENIITLDFLNKKCEILLKEEQLRFDIMVIFMDYKATLDEEILSYTLSSEPDVINTIIISKK